MTKPLPRIFLAATKSGSGKTLITCGLLKLLKDSGYNPVSFKCGPDYIDPMFHKKVLSVPSKNLDTFFTDSALTRSLFAESAITGDISVIEGVMGYYDGLLGTKDTASSYELAKTLEAPVILIIDAKGASLSLLPIIEGFLNFRKEHQKSYIVGIILNRISKGLYDSLKPIIEEELHINVVGFVPNCDYHLESRHLGLVTPNEINDFKENILNFSKIIDKTINLNLLIKLANSATQLEISPPEKLLSLQNDYPPLKIGVAFDKAFCFYYEDNLSLLKKLNVEIVYFSPLHDEKLVDGLDGLYIGGGYPELFAKELSNNHTMLKSIRDALNNSLPCIAECGGFMYLLSTLQTIDGDIYPMVNAISGNSYYTSHLNNFGYHEISANSDSSFYNKGDTFKIHEFHYYTSNNCGNAFTAKKPFRDKTHLCIHSDGNILAGYPHFYFYNVPKLLMRFLNKCNIFKKGINNNEFN